MEKIALFQHTDLICVHKPSGIPVQPDRSGSPSLLEIMKEQRQEELFLVHRLDRPVSGLVIFARTTKAATWLSRAFVQKKIQKTYLAAVAPPLLPEEGILTHHLLHDRRNKKSRPVPPDTTKAREARLKYRTLSQSDHYTLLEIQPETGRFHQIRAQLAASGSPIKGDVKYGARRSNRDRSIHLHAWKLHFRLPDQKAPLTIEAPLPEKDPLWFYFSQKLKTENRSFR
jgi:23S rRNA pseudouridine1911/1915/1917 synthase